MYTKVMDATQLSSYLHYTLAATSSLAVCEADCVFCTESVVGSHSSFNGVFRHYMLLLIRAFLCKLMTRT